MSAALTLTLLAAIVGGFLYFRSRSPVQRTAGHARDCSPPVPAKKRQDSGNFRSVGIDVGVNCCIPASRIAGERYLIEQAPKLPLKACTSEECNCKYIHFADRRSDDGDRRGLGLIRQNLTELEEGGERRRVRGRRVGDI